MSLIRKHRYITPDGKPATSKTPEAKRVRLPNWYGKYTDENGKRREVALCPDKAISRQQLAKLNLQVAERKAGLRTDFTEHASRPLADHLEEYMQHLTSKGSCSDHLEGERLFLNRIFNGCGFSRLPDVRPAPVETWLSNQRATAKRFGIATSNHHLRAIKGFCRWCLENGRIPSNPLASLKPINAETDVRHRRRSLSDQDFAKLLNTTRNSLRTIEGDDWRLTGEDRYFLYLTASMTGLRASELASVTPACFNFVTETPTLTVAATNTKNKQEAVLPLHDDLSQLLRNWILTRTLNATEKLWGGKWASHKKAGKILKRDLIEAGIDYKNTSGEVFDFHALRGQYITSLCRADVHPRKAQELARHSTIELTMKHYTKLHATDLAESLNRLQLPTMPTLEQKTAVA